MDSKSHDGELTRRSARVYLPVSVGASALFYFASMLTGDHDLVARLGGAVWIGLLSLIVTMPLATARARRRQQTRR